MSRELSSSDRALLHAKKRWAAFGELTRRYNDEIVAAAADLTPLERRALVDDADLFSETNCGWFEYEGVHKAAAEARWMVRRDEEADLAHVSEPQP